jgi:hypothetical protein
MTDEQALAAINLAAAKLESEGFDLTAARLREARAHIAARLSEQGAKSEDVNRPIGELVAEYDMQGWTAADCIGPAKRYVSTMPDSQVRCLLHIMSEAPPAAAVPVLYGEPDTEGRNEPQTAEQLADWLDSKYRRHGEIEDKNAATMLRHYAKAPPAAAVGQAERKPDGYAYRYPDAWGSGRTVIEFSGGQERNGNKPLEAIPYYFGTPPAAAVAEVHGYSDNDRARIVSALQSARDRMASMLPKVYGEGWDGDLDTMLEAINYMKRAGRISPPADSAGVTEAKLAKLVEAAQGFELIEHADGTWLVFRSSVENGLGSGSIRLDGPMAKDARARFAILREALSAARGK